jgi:hypothetical protein
MTPRWPLLAETALFKPSCVKIGWRIWAVVVFEKYYELANTNTNNFNIQKKPKEITTIFFRLHKLAE